MRFTGKSSVLAAVLVVSIVAAWQAAAKDETSTDKALPPIVRVGLEAYKTEGAEQAMKAWMKGRPGEDLGSWATQIAAFGSVEHQYGSYRGYEVVDAHQLCESTRTVYLVMNYDRGPLFVGFTCYRGDDSEIVLQMAYNLSATAIFPPALLTHVKL